MKHHTKICRANPISADFLWTWNFRGTNSLHHNRKHSGVPDLFIYFSWQCTPANIKQVPMYKKEGFWRFELDFLLCLMSESSPEIHTWIWSSRASMRQAGISTLQSNFRRGSLRGVWSGFWGAPQCQPSSQTWLLSLERNHTQFIVFTLHRQWMDTYFEADLQGEERNCFSSVLEPTNSNAQTTILLYVRWFKCTVLLSPLLINELLRIIQ